MSMVSRIFQCGAVFALCVLPLYGGEDDLVVWEAEWNAAAAEASFIPSVQAREIAVRELGSASDDPVEVRVRRTFEAAMRVERMLRLGYDAQEARIRLRRVLRLTAVSGPEKGKRISAALEKVERRNKRAAAAAAGRKRNDHKDARGR